MACIQLGFPKALEAVHGAFYGAGDGEIWLNGVSCRGTEPSLSKCSHSNRNAADENCSHYNDAGVVCLSKSLPIEMMSL